MATIDQVTICNMALTNIGASTIEAIDEGSPASNACQTWYAYSRLQALEVQDWNFARRRQTLTLIEEDPVEGIWLYRYQYPSDCVFFRRIQNPLGDYVDPIPFEVEVDSDLNAKSILTNQETPQGVYTFDQTVTSIYSPLFVSLLSFALASNIAYTLTGKQEMRKTMVELFNGIAKSAPAANANEQMAEAPPDTEWITGRE